MMSVRRYLIAANWKMHKTLEEARILTREVRRGLTYGLKAEVALAPPFTALAAVAEEIAGSITVTANDFEEVEKSCVGSGTNGGITAVALALTVAGMPGWAMVADQDLSLSFATSGSPIVIALKANEPLVWSSRSAFANLLTANVTSLTVTNAGATAATLKMRFGKVA